MVSERILNHVWLNRGQCFSKLCEAELSVSVKIKPSHDGSQLTLYRLVAYSLEESTNRGLIN